MDYRLHFSARRKQDEVDEKETAEPQLTAAAALGPATQRQRPGVELCPFHHKRGGPGLLGRPRAGGVGSLVCGWRDRRRASRGGPELPGGALWLAASQGLRDAVFTQNGDTWFSTKLCACVCILTLWH